MTRTVALYARVSTGDQDCARQVRDLEAWAARMGVTVVETFTETASGAKVDRALRARACEGVRKGRYSAILVTEPSRWSRSIIDLIETLNTLGRDGGSLLCLNGLSMDTATPTGKLMVSILGGIAEFERDLIRERIRSGMANKKAQGRYVGGRIKGNAPTQRRIKADVMRMRDTEKLSWDSIATLLSVSHNTARRAYAAK